VGFSTLVRKLLNHRGLRFVLTPLVNLQARSRSTNLRRVFWDGAAWIHETPHGYFAFREPFLRLDMQKIDEQARLHFLWGYTPRIGDVVMDVGAGVGEEVLTFSRAVGPRGKVICVEAHPPTYRCLEKLVEYNHLKNVTTLNQGVTGPSCTVVAIEDFYPLHRMFGARRAAIAATTIDAIHNQLDLGRINFLKMNIEGAERLAIKGMTETLQCTEILCICCHDFLAESTGKESCRTKGAIRDFFGQIGFTVAERLEPGLPPYVKDQVWAYNKSLLEMAGR
jgi:FkbM family methyltransferase